MTISGTALAAFTIAACVVWYLSVGKEMSLAVVMPLYALSFAAICFGAGERLGRDSRQQHQDLAEQQERIENGVFALADMLPEERRRTWYEAYAAGIADSATGTEGLGVPRQGVLRPVRDAD